MIFDWRLIIDIVLAVIFCVSVIIAIIAVRSELRSPLPVGRGSELFTVIAVRGRAESLDQTVSGLSWLSQGGKVKSRLIIADCGMDDYTRKLAALLARQTGDISVCKPAELARVLEEFGWKQNCNRS